MLDQMSDRRNAIAGSRKKVGKLSRDFSAAVVEGRQSLDEVVNTVLQAMPEDQHEVRLFFPGEVISHNARPHTPVWKERDWKLAMGTLGVFTALFVSGAMLSSGLAIPFFLAMATLPTTFGVVMTYNEEQKRRKPPVTRRKEGTLVRFYREENGEFLCEVWLGDYGSTFSSTPPDAPTNMRAVGNSNGWKPVRFSKVYQNRKLDEDRVLAEITALTDKWAAQADREWGLAEKLLRTHAGNIGMIE